MIDVTVSLLALIAGGITLELFSQSIATAADERSSALKWDTRAAADVTQDIQFENPS